jgi:hypothetical protein
MNLRKLFACAMLLGLLTSLSFAQRQRLGNGGTMPGARLPNAAQPNPIGISRNAQRLGNGGTMPGARLPNAAQHNPTDTKHSVDPNAAPAPDRVKMPPNTGDIGSHTAGAEPIQ